MPHIEGVQSVRAALSAKRRKISVVLVRRDASKQNVREVIELAETNGVPVRHVDQDELDRLAHGTSHGGVIAVALPVPKFERDELFDLLKGVSSPLLLLLEGVDDDRNLGFTIRSAEALGAHALLVKKHLWDFDETEVARASSGSYERLPIVQFEGIDLVGDLQKRGIQLLGCLAGARATVFEVDLKMPTILAIGGEKRGLSGAIREICDRFVSIPTAGGASSLSLSHAGAIVLSEAFRQRMERGK